MSLFLGFHRGDNGCGHGSARGSGIGSGGSVRVTGNFIKGTVEVVVREVDVMAVVVVEVGDSASSNRRSAPFSAAVIYAYILS